MTFLFIVFLVGIFSLTYTHPLNYYEKGRAKKLIEWISQNTPEDSVFFVRKLDSFLVRVYGNRAIFADSAFPFNNDYTKEFTERFLIYKNSDHFTPSDYACLKNRYTVDYLIIPSKKKFENYTPIFSSEKWMVYDINSFPIKGSCDKKELFYE